MKYKQLTLKERYHISTLLKKGWKQKEIAESIGVHPSTISREIRRNSDTLTKKYSYEFAHSVTLKMSQTDFKAPAEARCFDTAVNYLVSSSR